MTRAKYLTTPVPLKGARVSLARSTRRSPCGVGLEQKLRAAEAIAASVTKAVAANAFRPTTSQLPSPLSSPARQSFHLPEGSSIASASRFHGLRRQTAQRTQGPERFHAAGATFLPASLLKASACSGSGNAFKIGSVFKLRRPTAVEGEQDNDIRRTTKHDRHKARSEGNGET